MRQSLKRARRSPYLGLHHRSVAQGPHLLSLSGRRSAVHENRAPMSNYTFSCSNLSASWSGCYSFSEKPSPVWPAVPYSSLNRELDEVETPFGLDDFPTPPKLALNGVSNDIPISPYSKALSGMQDFESEESKARRREMGNLAPTYPEVVPHSLRKPGSSNTPVIPLSPDPFGRFPSVPSPPLPTSEDSESPERPPPQARIKYSTFGIPPERHSSLLSLGDDDTVVTHTEPESATPSSRFSLDSTDDGKNNRPAASLNPVKSIKSLWKKGRKGSISSGLGSAPPSRTGSGLMSPQHPVPNLPGPSVQRSPTPTSLNASRESVASLVPSTERYPPKVPHDTPLSSKSPSPRLVRAGSSTSSMVFDQESPYPVLVQSQRVSTTRPRTSTQPSSISSPTALARRSSMRQSEVPTESDAVPPHAMSPTDRERAGAPKSILKPWRSDNPAGPPLPEQFASRSRRSRGGSEAFASNKFPAMGAHRVSANVESTRPTQTSPPRRQNRGTLRTIPSSWDTETFKIIDPTPHPESGQSA